MKKYFFIFLILNSLGSSLNAQNKILKGRLISEQFDYLTSIPILIDDTLVVGETDINGFFQISVPVNVDKLLIKYVGLEPTVVQLVDACGEIEVVVMLLGTYDFMTFKKIDRLRLKRFKNLPKLHKEAFEKGLFKTEKACYIQEFLPRYPEKPKKA